MRNLNFQANSSSLLSSGKKERVVNRLIKEEFLMLEQHIHTCNLVILEEKRMISDGYTPEMINEAMFDWLKKVPGNIWSYFKQYFIEAIMRRMGLDPHSVFGYAFKNVLEEMEWSSISSYFGTGKCKELAELIVRGVGEGLQEKGMDIIVQALFGKSAYMSGLFSGTVREMITSELNDIMKEFRKPITDYVCSLKWGGLADGLKGLFGMGQKGKINPAMFGAGPAPATA